MSISSSLARSANEFAVDLFQCYLRRHGDKYINLLLCPYLIYHSLAMMLVGAKGETARQLMSLLRIKQKDPAQRHKEFLMLTEQMIHGNHDFIHLASFIYLDKTTKRTESFKTILRDYYETKPKKIDFSDVDLTVKTINEDVARTTENIYNDILSKLEAAKLERSMLLVSAVFFRGFWLSNFTDVTKAPFLRAGPKDMRLSPVPQNQQPTSGQTSPAPAPTSPTPQPQTQTQPQSVPQTQAQSQPQPQPTQVDVTTHMVQMMSKLDHLPVVADAELDARIVKMAFEASDLQMMLILPNDRMSNASYLCDRISAAKLERLFNDFGRTKSRSVRVTMPIFCIDSGKISIQSTLVTMGTSELFDKAKANMSGVCENKQIWLNKILHRCFIVCDNRGAITSSTYERARKKFASSLKKDGSLSMRRLTGCEEFIADHPFMYIIMDSVSKTILMIGLYTDPSETLEVVHENQLSPDEAHQIYTEGFYKT